MKRNLFIVLSCLVFPLAGHSQDILTTRSGEDILAIVTEITQTEVRYKKFDNKDGPTFIIPKSDMLMIRYENGTKDIFEQEPKQNPTTSATTLGNNEMYLKGQKDALENYRSYRGAGTGTLATSALTNFILGLIPAIACSATAPKEKNLNCPDRELLKNGYYYNGYVSQAHRTKRRKVWTNYLIGSAISTVILLSVE